MDQGMPEDKCALVAELVQAREMARQLETHMAVQQQGGGSAGAGGGDQRCRALVSTMRASIDRAVHMAASCCATEGRPGAGGQPESPPSGGGDGGSPRSGGSDQAGDFWPRGNATGQCKKRKTQPKWSTQVRVSAVQDVSPLDDGLSWRKYGQKDILGAKYPRAYFRCTHRHTQSCQASKHVQRTDGDPLLFDVVYHGAHTCAQGAAPPQPSNQLATEQQTTSPGGFEAGPAVLPFSLRPASNKPTTGAVDAAGGATNGRFIATGCVSSVTASPFVSPATPECQLAVSGGSGGTVAGVRNVPDVELGSTTNSPMAMGEMDFMFPLDAADFLELENPASYF